MESRSRAATKAEISRIRQDLIVHQRQIDTLWSGDFEMLSLLKAEKVVLYDEMSRLKRSLRS